jgi:hypothetical protein
VLQMQRDVLQCADHQPGITPLDSFAGRSGMQQSEHQ